MSYQISEEYWDGHQGLRLFRKSWENPDAQVLLVIAHGLGEHCDRYQNLIAHLDTRPFSIYSFDLRGHGRSKGARGHVKEFDDYSHDLELFLHKIRDAHPGLPLVLLGHSLGGMIAYHYVTHFIHALDGLILSSPGLISKIEVPAWQWKMIRLFNVLAPAMPVSSKIKPSGLSHDPSVIRAYEQDPLVHGVVSSRWFLEYNRAARSSLQRGDMIRMPLLIIHGAEDPITDSHGSQLVLEKARSLDKELTIFPGLYHETMNETLPQREIVLNRISDWLESRFLKPGLE